MKYTSKHEREECWKSRDEFFKCVSNFEKAAYREELKPNCDEKNKIFIKKNVQLLG